MSVNIDLRAIGGDGGSPTVTTSRMSVYFTDTGINLRLRTPGRGARRASCSASRTLWRTMELAIYCRFLFQRWTKQHAFSYFSVELNTGNILPARAARFCGACTACRRLLASPACINEARSTEVPLRRGALSVCPCGDPWSVQLERRHSWAPVKPPRGQTLRSPRPKVTSALARRTLERQALLTLGLKLFHHLFSKGMLMTFHC